MKVPSRAKILSNLPPLLWCSWQFDNFISIFLNGGLTNISDYPGDGVVGYSKYAVVGLSGDKVLQGDGQLETRFQCRLESCVLLGYQMTHPAKDLTEHRKLHTHQVGEIGPVFSLQLSHQTAIESKLNSSGYPGTDPLSFLILCSSSCLYQLCQG